MKAHLSVQPHLLGVYAPRDKQPRRDRRDIDGELAAAQDFLAKKVFAGTTGSTIQPDPACVAGFNTYIQRYKALLEVEKTAVEKL